MFITQQFLLQFLQGFKLVIASNGLQVLIALLRKCSLINAAIFAQTDYKCILRCFPQMLIFLVTKVYASNCAVDRRKLLYVVYLCPSLGIISKPCLILWSYICLFSR